MNGCRNASGSGLGENTENRKNCFTGNEVAKNVQQALAVRDNR